jgi:hypothetical protein
MERLIASPMPNALRLRRIEGIEKTIKTLRIQPWTRISHRNQYVGPFGFGQGFIL